MSSNLDLSLGDIIASGKKNRVKPERKKVARGNVKNNKVARSERREKVAPYKRDERPMKRTIENTSRPRSNSFGKSSSSILNRVGKVSPSGFPIEISNLNHDITDEEIHELCETIGKITSCNTKKDKSGKSFGRTIVHFSSKFFLLFML
jgi:RNA recognition motif-containing protein